MMKYSIKISLIISLIVFAFSSCKDYYHDTGVNDPNYPGTMLEYMQAQAPYYDSTLMVIELAGMKDLFEKGDITFFAPPSGTIAKSIKRLNLNLQFEGKDTVSKLEQISPEVWKSTLSNYIFSGRNLLKDYPQRDTLSYLAYPGQNYESLGGRVMNVGVSYGDAGGVKYAGYRQLYLAYIPDFSNPQVGLQNNPVATSDLQATNGVIHTLTRTKHIYGFVSRLFIEEVLAAGIEPATP